MISASARRLSVFKAVVDLGGFNAAADRLGIAQPSVGAHIKALERQVGQPLFYRQRGIKSQLTKAGETLYGYAVEVLERSVRAHSELKGLQASGQREIVIAAQRAIAHYFLPRYLTAFSHQHPEIRLVTRTGTAEDVLALLRAQAVDLGLFPSLGPLPGVRSEVLFHEPLLMVVAPSHPLATRKLIEPAELAAHPFVSALRDSLHFRMIDQLLRRIGVGSYRIAMELQDFAAVREVAVHGGGIACELFSSVREEIDAGRLVPLRLKGQRPMVEIRCAMRFPVPEAAEHFVELLKVSRKG